MPDPRKDSALILAPAGNKAAFLAALAAGADAVYCGLKQYSARMEAKNFSMAELGALTRLAHRKGTHVYVTLNTLLKNEELDDMGQLLNQLTQQVGPDAVIVQDLGMVELVRQTGYAGEVHLSTLSNVSCSAALQLLHRNLKVDRVVLPRELNVDEIKLLAQACPPELKLEVFVHGALCYGVSGRCYWSSYLGGKSGLRGRCVQPCRRRYTQKERSGRMFACQDLSLDVLVKVLKTIPAVNTWKIEGRKKGPHYVYYTVQAYRLLRDYGHDAQRKKEALALLAYALGRESTHYNFLPQRPQKAVPGGGPTGSGLLIGRVRGSRQNPYLVPREALMPGDTLRIGYEDDAWHQVRRLTQAVPAQGKLHLRTAATTSPAKGTPVFLVDRREKHLEAMLNELERELGELPEWPSPPAFKARLPRRPTGGFPLLTLKVSRAPETKGGAGATGVWLAPLDGHDPPPKNSARVWWWLPPVVWPASEKETIAQIERLQGQGARNFVLNAPWQIAWFENARHRNLWAGPFCNAANALAIKVMAELGFKGVIVSPELSRKDYLALPHHSPLPLGLVLSGNWPLCVSRTISEEVTLGAPFTSPKGEQAWVRQYGPDFWVYPNWRIDLSSERKTLAAAGYSLLIDLQEPVPQGVGMKPRRGLWNWQVGLP